ncbi:hypothetical protein ACIPJ2_18250 [Curtobacterium sp. NPDC090217]|uniref:hypothetical protein n=1 Tax=Curtobacterium sp. NPDC090217 TaxID=3363970 RepID=UPI003800E5D3
MRVIADTFIGSSGFNGLVNFTSAILIALDRDPGVEVVAVVPSGRALPVHDVLRRSGVHVEVLPAAIERVFRDPVRSSVMRESGLVAAARYNWTTTTAGLTKSVFDDVLLGRVPQAS